MIENRLINAKNVRSAFEGLVDDRQIKINIKL